jgi:hypothetical protein
MPTLNARWFPGYAAFQGSRLDDPKPSDRTITRMDELIKPEGEDDDDG